MIAVLNLVVMVAAIAIGVLTAWVLALVAIHYRVPR